MIVNVILVKELLEVVKIMVFIGICEKDGPIGSYLFCDKEVLVNLTTGNCRQAWDARCPLNKLLMYLSGQYPDDLFGVLVKG